MSRNPRTKQKRDATAARSAARRALIAEQAAIKAEAIAEEQAPAIQRRAIIDSDGVVIREALAVPDVKRGGYRRSDPLRNLVSKGVGGIVAIHLAAATRFSCDYEVGVCGAGGGGGDLERVDGAGAVGASERSLMAISRYRAACDAMVPAHRTVTQWVSLHRWPITECMKVAGVGYEKAMDYLLGGLDCLVDFYGLSRPAEAARVIADIVDPQVSDVPQERLGRARKIAA